MGSLILRNPLDDKEISDVVDMLLVCFPHLPRGYVIRRILCDPDYKRAHTFIVVEENRIVSHAHVFAKTMWWKGKKLPFFGLGFICTLPGFEKRGYASALVRRIINSKSSDLCVLFTKIPEFYTRFGFFVIPRRKFIIRKSGALDQRISKMRMRRFNFDRDIVSVASLHDQCFNQRIGAVMRDYKEWQSQLAYSDEDKKLFLVAEEGATLRAYLRCKWAKAVPKRVEMVEYASDSADDDLSRYLITALFGRFDVREISGHSFLLPHAGRTCGSVKEETDRRMMLRLPSSFSRDFLNRDEICFLESDCF